MDVLGCSGLSWYCLSTNIWNCTLTSQSQHRLAFPLVIFPRLLRSLSSLPCCLAHPWDKDECRSAAVKTAISKHPQMEPTHKMCGSVWKHTVLGDPQKQILHWSKLVQSRIKIGDWIAQWVGYLVVEAEAGSLFSTQSLQGEEPACVALGKLHSSRMPLEGGNGRPPLSILYL